jgi:hypothetical protein
LILPVLLSKSPHPSRESVGTRGSLSNISGTDGPAIHPARRIASRPSISSYGEELTAPRLRTLDGGSRRVLDRLSAFLSEDIGSALKGGAKVCQHQLVNEVLRLLVTEFVINFGRKDATPIQRAFQSGLSESTLSKSS